jgi:periplasmic copper chaperone A
MFPFSNSIPRRLGGSRWFLSTLALTLSMSAVAQVHQAPADAHHAHNAPSVHGQAGSTPDPAHDMAAITAVMKQQFDRPDSPLKVDPVSVEADWAVAGWSQDGRGGRALLQRRHAQWVILVCAGDDLKQAAFLASSGMAAATAQTLAARIQAAESGMSLGLVKQFSLFEGVIRLDGQQAHGHGHGVHAPAGKAHGH